MKNENLCEFTDLDWDVVVHSSRQSDWGGIVWKWPDHMQVAGHRAHEVQSQVTEGHKGVAKQTETLPRQDESALVVLPLLWQEEKPAWATFMLNTQNDELNQYLGKFYFLSSVMWEDEYR